MDNLAWQVDSTSLPDVEGGCLNDDGGANCPGISLSDQHQVNEEADQIDEEANELQKQVNEHSQAIQEIHKKLLSQKSASKAFKNLSKNQSKNQSAKDQSSIAQQPHQPISGEVKRLIEKEVFENSKKQVEVAKTFGISDRQVRRILDDARTQRPLASTNRRGPKSKLTTDVLTSVLLLLEDNPTTTLKKMSEHIREEFDISVTPAAIQKTLKTVDITWKTVTQIPRKWNEAAFLQQRHDYVLNRVTNVDSSISWLFVDWPCSHFENKCKRQPINLIGAMAEDGMIYYELLNEDGKKKTGTTTNDICNFLLRLQDHCPPGSIIIIETAPIHGGDDFEQDQLLIEESAKNLDTEFLPKYSPFLNPIELAFNILKTHTKICSRSDLVQAIQQAITEKMTPEICQKIFLHFHKFYQTCTHMQPITANIMKNPENFFQVPLLS
ncbi:hypothetical protein VP01_1032g1 [Puccinia sorghi]|uniref:Tc1-like transposase DDE domain-containing protein n=1 Tax=Puccinia sorghi TaxID=27349 RepID=A0A0L6VUS4_9BASI|nr:hypothetical protein VP01_1032g1 [Puccinia sorghi]